jgi:hypothetical protein
VGKQLDIEEARVLEAYRMEVIDAQQLGRELAKLRDRKAALETQHGKEENQRQMASLSERRRSMVEYCQQAGTRMRTFTEVERQQFLRLLHIQTTFTGNAVRIRGRLPTGAPGELPDSASPPLHSSGGRTGPTEVYLRARNPPAPGKRETHTDESHGSSVHRTVCRRAKPPLEVALNISDQQLQEFDFDLSAHMLPPTWEPPPRNKLGRFYSASRPLPPNPPTVPTG